MGHIHHINDHDFETSVLAREGVSIVDFWAPWCAPCRSLGTVLEECAPTLPHIMFFKINIDENTEVAARYQVRGIPTLLLVRDGTVVDTKVGALSAVSLKEWLTQCGLSLL